ncbi:UNVERIFIED_ORG: aspartate ammonia-lyase [Methylobacterium sp. SuP10 SLI 274]|uniref:aspartate ammonia-lyase n=1 Tax=Methylorubrum extorquens TaxID=408 RepID=UPI00209D7995|nr:aspartate ammonia-lyase [Methylorubrum extorquens]MCP1558354.1 aspartate ammonia-lyase [Methylorubrum extorquens]MDF9791972.1 aspartate ammonia-lyase [Methylorubrum extorquens]MDH6637262.1 aspartate ammonia-lyase [Methylobacterium sp. SuP10 SLI 274]MDH6666442.1 aspartate ammonia-lyase [Methylorubrum zatmanii]
MAKTASDTKAKHAAKDAAGGQGEVKKSKAAAGKAKGTGGKGGTGKKAARAEMKAAAIAAAEKAARPDALGTAASATAARATAENPPQEEDLAVATVRKVAMEGAKTRSEHDLLGDGEVPADALWGIHTKRAVANFPITGVSVGHYPELVRALALVKQAAARSNHRLGYLPKGKAKIIEEACTLVATDPTYAESFVVDAIQGGAGTSTNMNANEVIANVGLRLMGKAPGDYAALHPNDDVNMAQSTNDAYPTALRLAVIFATQPLVKALDDLAYAFKSKAVEFADVLKMGRTQLQDAVPMTLGQEFDGFHATIKEDVARLTEIVGLFREVNLGATAIGTGINADPRYAALAVEELSRLSGQPMVLASNLIEATSDLGAFVLFSGVLKRVAVKLSKICNDLRLLSSGPRTGFGEIRLPAVQAGSSIMPGKVNPVIPEVVNQVAYMVIGHDLTVTLCAEGGQLQLNAFEPTIGYCVLSSLRMLTAAIDTLTKRCIDGIEADRERCRSLVQGSIGLVTALAPTLGYEASSRIARRALKENRAVADLVLEEGLLTEAQLNGLLELEAMTHPTRRQKAGTVV